MGKLGYQSIYLIADVCVILALISGCELRRLRSVDRAELDMNPLTNSVEFIWGTTTVAVGDTAVLHCSFDAIFQQLRNGNINWVREATAPKTSSLPSSSSSSISASLSSSSSALSASEAAGSVETVDGSATPVASGKKIMVDDTRYRVYRPHNSALSVLIIRRAKKKDAGIYRCNLSGSSTRHKYMILNVTESKIEAQTSPATMRAKIGTDVTLWCNATGYPKPVVYWTREDRNRKLPDGSYQYWGNGLHVRSATESETGIYACFLDNFVQPIVSYKFSLMVEDNPWNLEGYKMRFDSKQWYSLDSGEPKPVKTKSYLLMCETRGASKPLPIIRWYRDGKALRNNRHFYIIEDAPESRASYASSTLVIMNFLSRFQGNYTCVASNVFRMKKLTFYVQGYLEPQDVEDLTDGRLPHPPSPALAHLRPPSSPNQGNGAVPVNKTLSNTLAKSSSNSNQYNNSQNPRTTDLKKSLEFKSKFENTGTRRESTAVATTRISTPPTTSTTAVSTTTVSTTVSTNRRNGGNRREDGGGGGVGGKGGGNPRISVVTTTRKLNSPPQSAIAPAIDRIKTIAMKALMEGKLSESETDDDEDGSGNKKDDDDEDEEGEARDAENENGRNK